MISNKLKWFFGLLLVFLLILGTNLVDRNNFRQVRDSIVSIYEDRLVAKDIIFELFARMERKNMALLAADPQVYQAQNEGLNGQIGALQDSFRQTKLTPKEKEVFSTFGKHFADLLVLEDKYLDQHQDQHGDIRLALQDKLTALKKDLRDLSKIQVLEGRRQMFIGKKAVESVELLTRLEIIMLIFIALLVQGAILYNPK